MLIDQNKTKKIVSHLFKNSVERECYLDLIKMPFLCTLCLLTSVLFSAVIPVDVLEFQLIYFDSCKTRNIFLLPSYKILCVTLIKLKVNLLELRWIHFSKFLNSRWEPWVGCISYSHYFLLIFTFLIVLKAQNFIYKHFHLDSYYVNSHTHISCKTCTHISCGWINVIVP